MKAKDFDKKFDDDKEDIIEDLDLSRMKRTGHEQKRVNVDFPTWMIAALECLINIFTFTDTTR